MSKVNGQQSTVCGLLPDGNFYFLINISCLMSTVNSQQSTDSCRTVIFNFQFPTFSTFQQHNHLQRQVEEHHLGVHVLLDMSLRLAQFVHDAEYVLLIHKGGEA